MQVVLSGLAALGRLGSAVCLLSLGLGTACSSSAPDSAPAKRSSIIGGEPTQAGAWPMVVFLDNGCTGVLLARDLVVYAAHCGTRVRTVWLGDALDVDVDSTRKSVELQPSPGVRSIATEHCQDYPAWQLGNGSDIAFCTLAEAAIDESELIRPMAGCNLSALSDGVVTTLVGFGRSGGDETFGTKRVLESPLLEWGEELEIGEDKAGTCAGDSGSPAFVRLTTSAGSEWQVLGILSSGISGEGCGVGYYTPLDRWLAWLNTTSARNVTPCFDRDGTWAPSASCLRPAIGDDGRPADADRLTPVYSDACGAPYAPAPLLAANGGCSSSTHSPASSGLLWLVLPVLAGVVGRRRQRTHGIKRS